MNFENYDDINGSKFTNLRRYVMYICLLGIGLFALCMLVNMPTASAWTSPGTGNTYTMYDIWLIAPSAVQPEVPNGWYVKQDIVISAGDRLIVNGENINVGAGYKFEIRGTMDATNSNFFNTSTFGTKWAGIVVNGTGAVMIDRCNIENAANGTMAGVPTVSQIRLIQTTYRNCITGLRLRHSGLSALLTLDRVSFIDCTTGVNTSVSIQFILFQRCLFESNTYGLYADGSAGVTLIDCIFNGNIYAIIGYDSSYIGISATVYFAINGGRTIMNGNMVVQSGGTLSIDDANITMYGRINVINSGDTRLYINDTKIGFVTLGVMMGIFLVSDTFSPTLVSIYNSSFYIASGNYIYTIQVRNCDFRAINSEFRHNESIPNPGTVFDVYLTSNIPTVIFENVTIKDAQTGISTHGDINPKPIIVNNSMFNNCDSGIKVLHTPIEIGYSYFNCGSKDIDLNPCSYGKIHNNTFIGRDGFTGNGVEIHNGFEGTISDNNFVGEFWIALYFEQDAFNYLPALPGVYRNTFSDVGIGIYCYNFDVYIEDNVVSAWGAGLYYIGGNGYSVCINNTFSDGGYGVFTTSPITISGGQILNCFYGLTYLGSSIPVRDLFVMGCKIGIESGDASYTRFENCSVINCKIGFVAYSSDIWNNYPATLSNCYFENNAQGVLNLHNELNVYGSTFTHNKIGVSGAIGLGLVYENGNDRVITYGFGIDALGYSDRYYLMGATLARLGSPTTAIIVDDDRGSNSEINIVSTLNNFGIAPTVWNVVGMGGYPS
ncbi:MAG: hypothetical protein QXT63_09360, partial [Thermoplasmata archaeon]